MTGSKAHVASATMRTYCKASPRQTWPACRKQWSCGCPGKAPACEWLHTKRTPCVAGEAISVARPVLIPPALSPPLLCPCPAPQVASPSLGDVPFKQ